MGGGESVEANASLGVPRALRSRAPSLPGQGKKFRRNLQAGTATIDLYRMDKTNVPTFVVLVYWRDLGDAIKGGNLQVGEHP